MVNVWTQIIYPSIRWNICFLKMVVMLLLLLLLLNYTRGT